MLVCVAALIAIGMAVLFSASSRAAGGAVSYLYKQLIFLALALGAGWTVARSDLEQLRKYSWVVGIVVAFLLILVLIPGIGVSVKGSRRWLNLGFTRLQVSEFAKLAMSIAIAFTGFAVLVLNNPNRLRRILSFLDVEANRSEGGYQPWQAMLAFASGGVDGVGLGNGRQQQSFLPEAHTDYIFAILGEEMGLIFTLLVVVLFVTIFVAGLMHVRRAPNLFQFLLVTGCILLITLQAIINFAVVTSLMPSTGWSLPFISAGGSNLLLLGFVMGIIINTARPWERPRPLERRRALAEVAA